MSSLTDSPSAPEPAPSTPPPAPEPAPSTPPPAPEPAPSTPPPSPPSAEAPPPAAVIVTEGKRTEREIELQEELRSEREARIDRERRISELEDENFQLIKIPPAPPTPARRPPARRLTPVIRLEE